MHYYQFNIGDYFKHTRHLTLLEDLAYRRLLDYCYTSEKPIQKSPKQIARLIGMPENQAEVEQVLEDFFVKSSQGYFQSRIAEEIEKFHSKADSARANGKKGGRPKKPKKTQSVNLANPEESESKAKKSESKANHKPITNNHKPITNNHNNNKPASLVNSIFESEGINSDQIKEIRQIRKSNKGGTITERVAKSLVKEFVSGGQLGWSLDDMLTEWASRGWKSFKAEWLPRKATQNGLSSTTNNNIEMLKNLELN